MEWAVWAGWILAVVLVVAGIAGAVLPMLPGIPLVFAGLLLMGWMDDWVRVPLVTWIVLTVLLVVGVLVDFLSGSVGARKVGASPKAVTGAAIGSVVGIFFGPIGLLLGPFVGALLGELASERGFRDATNAGVAATVGFLIGTAAKIAISLAMIGVFSFSWFT